MRNRLAIVGWVLLVASACTEADLYLPEVLPEPAPQVKTNEIKGSFCTEDPATLVFPLKVWFVIDDSGSMNTSDPNQRRYGAVKELVDKLNDPGKRYFGGEIFAERTGGIIRFSQPDRFTDDINQFKANVDAVASSGNGATPYLNALALALSELTADVKDAGLIAKRSRYVIIFLSDGVPVPADTQPDAEILSKVDTIMDLKDKVGDITLNTVFLGGAGGDAAMGILRQMAEHGKGVFKSFPNGDALDYSGFDFSSIRRTYNQRMFVATNRSMFPVGEGQVLDSDLDGIPDATEKKLGSDPTSWDTDGDGCNDLMEHRVGWDPVVPGRQNRQCGCFGNDAQLDTDKDGLNDCEEKWLNLLPSDPDSDIGQDKKTQGDMVPDLYDFIYLDDATFPNNDSDRDIDGHDDLSEFRFHTSTLTQDANREKTAYQYVKYERSKTEPRCFEFEISNVTLGRTLAASGRAAGENLIELYFAQSTGDDPHKDRMFRIARKTAKYSEGGGVVINFEPKDFSELLVSSGSEVRQ